MDDATDRGDSRAPGKETPMSHGGGEEQAPPRLERPHGGATTHDLADLIRRRFLGA